MSEQNERGAAPPGGGGPPPETNPPHRPADVEPAPPPTDVQPAPPPEVQPAPPPEVQPAPPPEVQPAPPPEVQPAPLAGPTAVAPSAGAGGRLAVGAGAGGTKGTTPKTGATTKTKDQNGPTAGNGDGQGGGLFKELVTAVIALVVVGATMWVFIHAFDGADREVTVSGHDIRSPALLDKRIQLHEQAQSNRKDILTVGISLLSVILGFYFGRVPAERRAERAEREAGKAHDTEKQALAGARDAEDRGRGAETRAKDATHARERAEDKVKDARATVGRLQRTLAPTVQRRKTLAAAGKPAPNPEIDGAVEELNALLERLS